MTDTPKAKKPPGRPTLYTPELAEIICLRLMEGESLRRICLDEGMPAPSTVCLWTLNDPVFREKYDLARKVAAELEFDEIKYIADTPEIGETVTTESGKDGTPMVRTVKADMTRHRELQINSRKFILARKDPKRFGDKAQLEHSGPGGGPIEVNNHVSLTDAERADGIARILDAARARRAGQAPDAAEDVGTPAGPTNDRVRD